MTEEDPIAATRRWVNEFVIGLNLCPFARKVFDAGRVRFVVTDAADEVALLEALDAELRSLVSSPRAEVETTILIHPRVLADFQDYNDFLATAERRVDESGFRGVVQIASFHPNYQFAGTRPDDVDNYTNRSPYPMLHLLREASVTEVAGDETVLLGIPGRNVAVLRGMGVERISDLVAAGWSAHRIPPRSGGGD